MQYQVVWRWIISLGTTDGHRPGSLGSIALNWERFSHWPWIASFLAPLPSQAHNIIFAARIGPASCVQAILLASIVFRASRTKVGTTSFAISTFEHVTMYFVPCLSADCASNARLPPISASYSADLRGSSRWTLSSSPPPQPGIPPLPRGPT